MDDSVRVARLRVIDALAVHKAEPTESSLSSLKAAIEGWLVCVEAWATAGATS